MKNNKQNKKLAKKSPKFENDQESSTHKKTMKIRNGPRTPKPQHNQERSTNNTEISIQK